MGFVQEFSVSPCLHRVWALPQVAEALVKIKIGLHSESVTNGF